MENYLGAETEAAGNKIKLAQKAHKREQTLLRHAQHRTRLLHFDKMRLEASVV